jgi:hypothetical protein
MSVKQPASACSRSVGLHVLYNLIQVIAPNLDTLRELSRLQQSCRTLYERIQEEPQLYRSILESAYIINKTQACSRFMLTKADLCTVAYHKATWFPIWQRMRFAFPRGHLVYPCIAFDLSLRKHKDLKGIARAYVKRRIRQLQLLRRRIELMECIARHRLRLAALVYPRRRSTVEPGQAQPQPPPPPPPQYDTGVAAVVLPSLDDDDATRWAWAVGDGVSNE